MANTEICVCKNPKETNQITCTKCHDEFLKDNEIICSECGSFLDDLNECENQYCDKWNGGC